MTQIQDTVNESMTSAISLLHPIAIMNSDPALQSVFFDPANGAAICGFRREVANFGVCLVRAEYGRNNEVKVREGIYNNFPGLINYNKRQEYIETNEGLLGTEVKDGYKEIVNNEVAIRKIDDVRNAVEGAYEVGIQPGAFFRFMKEQYKDLDSTHRDRKVNLQFTAGVPQGYLIATMQTLPGGEIGLVTKVPVKGQMQAITLYPHESSKVHPTRMHPKLMYMVKPVGVDQKTGRRYVDVARPYREGIRMAMQAFKMGIIKPGDRGYDVNPDNTNGLRASNIRDFSYLPGQKRNRISGAPMMTVDLDMFYSLMHTMSGYPVVVMKFKNSTTGIYLRAEGNEYMPTLEAIMGPTIQHVRGRIWLP